MLRRTLMTLAVIAASIAGFFASIGAYAVTVDPLVPGEANLLFKVGDSTWTWTSLNNVLYTNAGNLGVRNPSPAHALDVVTDSSLGGVMIYSYFYTRPTCASGVRGTVWLLNNSNATDTLAVCIREANGTHNWVRINHIN